MALSGFFTFNLTTSVFTIFIMGSGKNYDYYSIGSFNWLDNEIHYVCHATAEYILITV